MIKQAWIYIGILLSVVLSVVAIAIWQSSSSPLGHNASSSSNKALGVIKGQADSTSAQTLPENTPAPAKKLQKLLDDVEQPLTVDATLQERIQIFDNTLADIDAELQAKGLSAFSLTGIKLSAAPKKYF